MHIKVFRQSVHKDHDSFIHALVDRVVAGWNEASVRRTPGENDGRGDHGADHVLLAGGTFGRFFLSAHSVTRT